MERHGWQIKENLIFFNLPVFGGDRYKDNMTSERVDFQGVSNVVKAATTSLPISVSFYIFHVSMLVPLPPVYP